MEITDNQTNQWIKTVKVALLLLVGLTSIFPLPAIADNQPPQAVGAIAPVTLIAGSSAATVDLSGSFFDPDGDALTYSAQSSNTGVVTASVTNSTITITPVAAGVTTIIVIVQDTGGLTITQNITITVNPAPNRAPVVVETINPLTLTAGTDATTIDMAAHFSDPDSDPLTYTARIDRYPRGDSERIKCYLRDYPGSTRHNDRHDNGAGYRGTHHHPQRYRYGESRSQPCAGDRRSD